MDEASSLMMSLSESVQTVFNEFFQDSSFLKAIGETIPEISIHPLSMTPPMRDGYFGEPSPTHDPGFQQPPHQQPPYSYQPRQPLDPFVGFGGPPPTPADMHYANTIVNDVIDKLSHHKYHQAHNHQPPPQHHPPPVYPLPPMERSS